MARQALKLYLSEKNATDIRLKRHIKVADALTRRYHHEDSLTYLDKALEIQPDSSTVMAMQVVILLRMQRLDESDLALNQFIEKQKSLCNSIEEIAKQLRIKEKCRIINANSTSINFNNLNDKFDLIFLDPPFHEKLIQRSLDIIDKNALLAKNGLVYIECEKDFDINSLKTKLGQMKQSKGGQTKFYLYES